MKCPLTVLESPEASDGQRTLLKLAADVVVAAQSVSRWVEAPGAHNLADIATQIARCNDTLQKSIAAFQEADIPSLAQLEWRCQIASDKSSRAWNDWDALTDEWASPVWNAAKATYEATYQEYLQARRDLRSHPNWTPKRQRNARSTAVSKRLPAVSSR